MINMDNVSSSGPLNDPDGPDLRKEHLSLLEKMTTAVKALNERLDCIEGVLDAVGDRLKKLEAPPEVYFGQSLTTCTKMISDTYAYLWRRTRPHEPDDIVEVDIRYVYTPAIPPITIGPPDAWVEGESATLTIDTFSLGDLTLAREFQKHLDENRDEIELEIIESIEANLTDC